MTSLKSEFSHNIINELGFKNIITNNKEKLEKFNNFTFFGEITFSTNKINSTNTYFEIYCRISSLEKLDDIDKCEIEIIFKDITRSKIYEEQKLEIKYKTVFLSKVAHEFKNPLISIVELINQIESQLLKESLIGLNKIHKRFKKIKAMSNFLLILVKDLDFFSQVQINKEFSIEKSEVDIFELVDFCKGITKSLIKKLNRSKQVKFLSEIKDGVPKIIMGDAWKIKQILVNLLSNAVKFTIFGKIKLEISKINTPDIKKIKFLVKDTGVGISEERFSKIFNPYEKSVDPVYNDLGSGLGLSIVSNLTKIIGGEVNFSSSQIHGSSFWLTIPLIEKENENKLDKEVELYNFDKVEFIKNFNENCNKKEFISSEKSEQISDNKSESQKTKVVEYFLIKPDINILEQLKNSGTENFQNKMETSSPSIILKEKNNNNFLKINSNQEKEKIAFNLKDIINLQNTNENILKNDCINIIVVDDEKLTRSSIIRNIMDLNKQFNSNINIIESEDGVEGLFIVYKLIKQGVKISMIFSDETMQYLNGSLFYKVLKEILINKNMLKIPFYLVTALSEICFEDTDLVILQKPLRKEDLIKVFKKQNIL